MADRAIPDNVVMDALILCRSLGAIRGFAAESTKAGRRAWRVTLSPGNVLHLSPAAANAFALGAMSALKGNLERQGGSEHG